MKFFTYFTVFLLIRSASFLSHTLLEQIRVLLFGDLRQVNLYQFACYLFLVLTVAILAANMVLVNQNPPAPPPHPGQPIPQEQGPHIPHHASLPL